MSIELRQDFINYYRDNDHKFMKPSKVFNDDKSLLFVNAGMNQLKQVFLGEKDYKFNKLTNYQICIRAGGKHNDFDDVGFDHTHLTSFEMLGNWSIDAYDKKTAITLAFNYLTENLKLDKSRLYATYFCGKDTLPLDNESKSIWETLLPSDHVVEGDYNDNFWMMADEGPCGVCTEIHYDMIGNRSVPELVNVDDSVVEIWNIVFIQYNKINEEYNPLGKLFVDTGMGLERICMILQNKKSVYETDCFRYLFGYAQALTNSEFYSGNNSLIDISYRIFCDHMRTVVNALFDGVEFDAHGRGNVLKKIFRRGLTYTYVYLNNGSCEPLMNKETVRGMITHILCYFLKNKHDVNSIQNMLIEDEKLYLGKLFSSRKRYNKLKKEGLSHENILTDMKKSSGVDEVIISNMEKLKFTMYE